MKRKARSALLAKPKKKAKAGETETPTSPVIVPAEGLAAAKAKKDEEDKDNVSSLSSSDFEHNWGKFTNKKGHKVDNYFNALEEVTYRKAEYPSFEDTADQKTSL